MTTTQTASQINTLAKIWREIKGVFVRPFRKTFGKRRKRREMTFKKSYSQSGEDILVLILLAYYHQEEVYYLDIGANHPTDASNTYLFYEQGHCGIIVEPNPILVRKHKEIRPNDLQLNVGVTAEQSDGLDFYVMNTDVLSTFSKETALEFAKFNGQKIERVEKVRTMAINDILRDHCKRCPDFVSVDVEGLDFEILNSWDFAQFRPKIFCIETASCASDGLHKLNEVKNLMLEKQYRVYADTFINTIFVDGLNLPEWIKIHL